jgi:hypothetical protein
MKSRGEHIMTEVSYPSAKFPGPVALSLQVPDGWSELAADGQVIALAREVPEGHFRPNVLVSVNRVTKGTGLAPAIADLHARGNRLTDFVLIGEEDGTLDGWPAYRIEMSFRHPEAGTLAQAARLACVDRGVAEDIVQLTATCGGDQVKDLWPEIRAISGSLRITAA